ncbi:hypothetical protein KFL_000590360 [Klebsormidium nitens]|uniref:TFIIS N-terminal domain-containing protein n=1 Tax=Klebsormidium nitens TaxID=105231 RepID=A0A1Y1HRF8_KLENI|nr:hypothetical protein KFL_000590360 [Klebsormidium nitens]|eukprot:GAQ80683.1 hypothetical protein KFL_000590360 [Klebsormidium nitens]
MSDDNASPSVPKNRRRTIIESDEEEEEEFEETPQAAAQNGGGQENGAGNAEEEEHVGAAGRAGGMEAEADEEGPSGADRGAAIDDEDEGLVEDQQAAGEPAERKQKKQSKEGGDREPKKRRKSGEGDKESRKRKQPREKKTGRAKANGEGEEELFDFLEKEGGSEDDSDGVRNAADDAFIDDDGVRKAYDSEDEYGGDPGRAPQAEEAEEDDGGVDALFGKGKKGRKTEKSDMELQIECEEFIALMAEAAESDAESNRAGRPALKKLQMLPNVVATLSNKKLQMKLLQQGVLIALKQWLEPLPDRSLPNIAIRTAILRVLSGMPIDTSEPDVRDWLKDSYLGRVVMFLSRLPDETADNRAVARDLVDKWSRPIFKKSTNYEELRHRQEEHRPAPKQKAVVRRAQSGDDDAGEDHFDAGALLKPGDLRLHATIPQPAAMDYKRRSQSKVTAEEARALAKGGQASEKARRMDKTLQKLRKKTGSMRAEKVSVEGRGLIKYI